MKENEVEKTSESNEVLEHLTILGNDKPEPSTAYEETKNQDPYNNEPKPKKRKKVCSQELKEFMA